MLIEGIEIKGYLRMDDTLLMKSPSLEEFAKKCIRHGKEIALTEHEEETTYMDKYELMKLFKTSFSTLRRWRKYGHRKHGRLNFAEGARIRMTVKDAKEFRNKLFNL